MTLFYQGSSFAKPPALGTRVPQPRLLRSLAAIANRALDCLGYGGGMPDADEIMAAVASEPGVQALARWDVRAPLDQWCAALQREANLNGIGRLAAHWDAVRLLRTMCRLTEEEARRPGCLEEPIRLPIFITGMPRSGTTFLHNLLALDPANGVPRCWQGMAPYPPRRGRDRRHHQVEQQMRLFNRLAPGLASVHPLTADTPQECSELMAPVFRSLRFDTTHRVPSYRRWLDHHGYGEGYRFHRQFLQHLQHQSGRRQWVLKCPDHVFALDAVEQAYPDARYVFLHRDPLAVLPSVARLTQLLREPFTRAVDLADIGSQVRRDCHDSAQRMIATAQARSASDNRVIHLHYSLIRDRPLEAVRAIYSQFDLELAPAARSAMEAEIARRPRGEYGRNVYRFEEFSIDPIVERERFQGYTDQFDVMHEVRP